MSIREALCRDPQGERQDYAMRLAMKTLNRAILGAHRMASALLLSGFVLCNFGAQADVLHSKIGGWSVVYREVGNLSGCLAAAQFPDQTIFQMGQIQSGTDKAWIIFISNPRWDAWIGKRKELRLWLVTDWPTTKPWPYTFSTSGDSKTLSTTDASVEFMNSVADASKVEIKDDNGALLTTVDMKDSAAAIRAIVTCVSEHPDAQKPFKCGIQTGGHTQQHYPVKTQIMIWFCCKPIWTIFRQPPSNLGHRLATRWPPMAFPTQASCPPRVTVRWDMLRP